MTNGRKGYETVKEATVALRESVRLQIANAHPPRKGTILTVADKGGKVVWQAVWS
jgi:hypothetical protein